MHFKNLLLFVFLWATLPVVSQTQYGVKVAAAAQELTKDHVVLNGSYFSIPYPNGDVPKPYVVCKDAVIRTFRTIEIVSKTKSKDQKHHVMVHYIGAGQVLEHCLFNFIITGHYRYGK
jgi:hypothetical protein